jgi:hypothetical protein
MHLTVVFVFEWQFVSWMPFGSTKEGHIKHMKDVSCIGCECYDDDSLLGEKTDKITSDMTRTIIHQ